MARSNPALLVCVLLMTLSSTASGCSSSGPSTQLVVLMDTDYTVPTEVDRIRARVLRVSEDEQDDTETWSKVYSLSGEPGNNSGPYSLPATFGVLPADGDIERIFAIELEALPPQETAEDGSGEPLVRSRVETGFVPGESRLVRMYLFRDCESVACAQDETCGCADADCSFLTCNAQFIEAQSLEAIENASQLPANATIPSQGCTSPRTVCGDECVDTTSNPSHCGECGTVCGSRQVCTGGVCTDLADCRNEAFECSGFNFCDEDTGECVRGCEDDSQCGSSETCDISIHECVCREEFTLCAEICVDTVTDPRFCGTCEIECPTGEVCQDSACVDLGDCRTNGVGCTGFTYCDPSTGDCLVGCERNEQCGGVSEICDIGSNTCVCELGFQRCPALTGSCVDTQTDPEFCGNCATACGVGELCGGGECFDPDDCRRPGNSCSGFTFCDQATGDCLPGCGSDVQCPRPNDSCDLGTNDCQCDPGFLDCSGACVNTATDRNNCGRCGTVCGVGEVCGGGECFDPEDCRTPGNSCSGFTFCDQATGDCLPGCGSNAQCPRPNDSCDLGSNDCVCDPGFLDCSGACVNTATDRNNCGSCGSSCGANQLCCNGTCTATTTPTNCGGCGITCGAGQACCNGACTATTTPTNCGGCGITCGAGQACCSGGCTTTTTEPNCGGCGITCGAGQACCNGACTTTTTVTNCGGCGITCGAGQACCGGGCTDITTEANCGSCGTVCPLGETCVLGTCIFVPPPPPPPVTP